jgi:non-heme chloroperoxidase
MESTFVTGGGGTRLHIVETGNPGGRPILFLHGFSQSWLAWSRQMDSNLAQDHRLVAMDLRGHGLSEKPHDAYGDSRLWAEDIDAVVRSRGLERAVLCGWSYGALVILDYLRHYGEAAVAGIHLVDAITKLGSDAALSVLTPEFIALVPALMSADAEESVRGLTSLLRLCFAEEPAEPDLYLMLGYNAAVPPHVRQALLSRSFDNDDLLPKIRTAVLISHGAAEAVVKASAVEQHRAGLPHAQVQMIPNAGHAPFWDAAAAFNASLGAFADSV